MISITPLILTFNEKENIARTLAALDWAEQILIIDSGSTDGTREIARQSHPRVHIVERAFDDHTTQWNFGIEHVPTEWVLSLDADYEPSSELTAEIRKLQPPVEIAGYSASFEFRIFGHPLRTSVYPRRTILFRRDRARYRSDGHTQLLEVNGPVLPLTGRIYHDDRKPLSRWLQSQDRYAIIEARHLLATSGNQLGFQDRVRRKIFLAPPLLFLYLLFVRGLILDGWPGWFYVFQRTLAEILLSIRLLIEEKGVEPANIADFTS